MTGAAVLGLAASGAAAPGDGGSGAKARSETPTSVKVLETAKGQLIRGRSFEGATLYVTGEPENAGWTPSTVYEKPGDDWSEVGTVAELVISQDSAYAGIVAEAEGRRVFLSIQDLALVLPGEGKVAYVTKFSPKELSNLPEVSGETWH